MTLRAYELQLQTTLTTSIRPAWSYFGASVCGPLHESLGLKNQDAWLGHVGAHSAMIAVCDGLGSRPLSGLGATTACLAVRDAVRYWHKLPAGGVAHLPRLIRAFWEMRLGTEEPSDCGTTCLFSAVASDGGLVIGGLGDGLAMVHFPNGRLDVVVGHRTGFSNQTLGLGVTHRLADWQLHVVKDPDPEVVVVLASDGVADDLVENRLGEFTHWLSERFFAVPARLRGHALRRELRAWPTPRHQDDKTVAVLAYRIADQRER